MKRGIGVFVAVGIAAFGFGVLGLEGCSGTSSAPPGDDAYDSGIHDSDGGHESPDAAPSPDGNVPQDAGSDGGQTSDAEVDSAPIEDSGPEDSGLDASHGKHDGGVHDAGATDGGTEDGGKIVDSGEEGDATSLLDAGLPIDSSAGFPEDGSVEQPPAPDAGATTFTAEHTFAVHHIHLGDEISSATQTPDWFSIGYDLDHKATVATSTDVCTRWANASPKAQADGIDGIDNSFGENIVPLLGALMANPSAVINGQIAAGGPTWVLDTVGIDEANHTQTATALSGQFFSALAFNQAPNAATATPTFTTADNWPLDPASIASHLLDAGALATPVVSTAVFSGAYIAGGTFSSGAPGEITLALPVSGHPLILKIRDAQVTFSNNGTNAAHGVISGVILTSDLVASVHTVAGSLSTSFCNGATLDSIVTAVEQASDILHDGTNVAGTACDAISIGIGFDADEIGAPRVAGVPVKYVDPCADAAAN